MQMREIRSPTLCYGISCCTAALCDAVASGDDDDESVRSLVWICEWVGWMDLDNGLVGSALRLPGYLYYYLTEGPICMSND